MRVIKPSATLMEHNVHPYEFIEKVGRTCYKSEDKITRDSAEKFVEGLVKRRHYAMLEHETLYLIVSDEFMKDLIECVEINLEDIKFLEITTGVETDCDILSSRGVNIISGSFRSFIDLFENCDGKAIRFLKSGMQYNYPTVFGEREEPNTDYVTGSVVMVTREEFINIFRDCSGILFKHLTHTFKFVCDRGVSHEFVRHRVASFAQESTRYCNYSLDKFGDEITYILPCFFEGEKYSIWEYVMKESEKSYFDLLKRGATPQEARSVLPNSLKTELIITATEKEWQHIVNLRLEGITGAPHPQMKEVMNYAINDLLSESEGRIMYEAN